MSTLGVHGVHKLLCDALDGYVLCKKDQVESSLRQLFTTGDAHDAFAFLTGSLHVAAVQPALGHAHGHRRLGFTCADRNRPPVRTYVALLGAFLHGGPRACVATYEAAVRDGTAGAVVVIGLRVAGDVVRHERAKLQ